MAIDPVPFPRRPFSSITPFTYSDAMTHLELIEKLRSWLKGDLVPQINDLIDMVEGNADVIEAIIAGMGNVIVRNQDGNSYPPRVDGYVNIYIGTLDPGLAADSEDVWLNPDVATHSSVAGEMMDPSSLIYSAMLTGVNSFTKVSKGVSELTPFGGAVENTIRPSGNGAMRYPVIILDEISQQGVMGVFVVPEKWNKVSVSAFYDQLPDTTAGNVRMTFNYQVVPADGDADSPTTQNGYTQNSPVTDVTTRTRRQKRFTGVDIDVVPGDVLHFMLNRRADLGGDTHEFPIQFTSMMFEREG